MRVEHRLDVGQQRDAGGLEGAAPLGCSTLFREGVALGYWLPTGASGAPSRAKSREQARDFSGRSDRHWECKGNAHQEDHHGVKDGKRVFCEEGEGRQDGAAMFQLYRPRVASVAIVGLLLVMLASQAAPQPPTVQEQALVIEGRVLWIDFGSQMMVLEPAYGGPAVTIDLHRIRQSDYHGFRGNEYVRVVGFIPRPSRRVQAFGIYLVSPWYPSEPQSP
jgi:hypothetical protein